MNNLEYAKPIITDLAILSERADEIDIEEDSDKLQEIIRELKDTILSNDNISALTAPQIGHNARVFCINFSGDIRTFINPVITEVKGLSLVRESCPSLPGREFVLPRNNSIVAIYQTGTEQPEANRFEGVAAAIFQQQVNLLDGIVLSDFGLEIFDDFDNATEEERTQLLDFYVDSLKQYSLECNEEIESNEELKQISDAITFINKVSTGEVTLEYEEAESDNASENSDLVC